MTIKIFNPLRVVSFLSLTSVLLFVSLGTLSASGLTIEGDKVMADGTSLKFGTAAWAAEMKKNGLVSFYNFRETSGIFLDKAQYRNSQNNPENVNLVINPSGSNRVQANGNFVKLLGGGRVIRSQGVATKIIRECKASNQLSIELWIRNNSVGEKGLEKEPVIVGMSNARDGKPSHFNRNFSLGLRYDEGDRIYSSVKTDSSETTRGTSIQSDAGIPAQPDGDFQHIIYTTERNSDASRAITRLYVSRVNDTGKVRISMHKEETLSEDLKGLFSNWDSGGVLTVGNEVSFSSQNGLKDWAGEIHMLAIYCKALTRVDIEGAAAPKTETFARIPASLNVNVTPSLLKAALIYKRLNGVGVPISSPVLARMEPLIAAGDTSSLRKAAEEATKDVGFLNITVRDFASRMSTRDETVNTELNDFSATVIGVVRDNASAKDLLVGNYFYHADENKAAVPTNLVEDILKSNRHYQALEKGKFDLGEVLVKKTQQIYDGKGKVAQINPDPAGLISTRAFMGAHAIAGTNRRPVEYAFRQFMCAPLETWADSTAPDDFVGRDIDRFPAGDHENYKTTCRACHSVMDGFRGAFAYVDFQNGFTKYSPFQDSVTDSIDDDDNRAEEKFKVSGSGVLVAAKLNHNDQGQGGPIIKDNRFVNNATKGVNGLVFGWSGKANGSGMKDFGRILADSEAFPRCMARRVFRSVCKREPASFDESFLEKMGRQFSNESYNLKKLFEAIVVSKECLGK